MAKTHSLNAGAMHFVNVFINDDEAPLAHSWHGLLSQLVGEGAWHNIAEERLQGQSHYSCLGLGVNLARMSLLFYLLAGFRQPYSWTGGACMKYHYAELMLK